jgi:hypothetical protein
MASLKGERGKPAQRTQDQGTQDQGRPVRHTRIGELSAPLLESCPRCGNKRLSPPSPSMVGMRVCLSCGIVDEGNEVRLFTVPSP